MERTGSSETSKRILSDTVQDSRILSHKLPLALFVERREGTATTPTLLCDVQSETDTAGVQREMPDRPAYGTDFMGPFSQRILCTSVQGHDFDTMSVS
jgi:hypothetical protein